MTRTQIRSLVSNFCEDPDQSVYANFYNDAINRAQEQFVMDSKCLFGDSAISVVSGTANYDLPSDFIMDKKVTLDNSRLDPISRATLEYYQQGNDWTIKEGSPRFYVIDPEEAKKEILLYPIPQEDDAGTGNLILTYFKMPEEMTADSDIPFNDSSLLIQFHMGIAAYAAWLILNYKPLTSAITAKKAEMWKMYQDKVTEAINTFGNSASEPLRMKGGRYFSGS